MESNRGLAMNILAVPDLFYPASPNSDSLAIVLNVGPLQATSRANAQACCGDKRGRQADDITL